MPVMHGKNFKGTRPLLPPLQVPPGFSQTARNTSLERGRIESFYNPSLVETIGAVIRRTIYNAYPGCLGDTWFGWQDDDISIVELQLAGDYRFAYSDPTTYPKITSCDWAGADGNPPATTRRLGVIAPTAALNAPEVIGAAGALAQASVNYVYTVVDEFGHESAPSPASGTVDLMEAQYARIKGFVKPTLAATGNDIKYFRLYRLVTAADGSYEYQIVKARPVAIGNDPVFDLPATDPGGGLPWISGSAVYAYDVDDGVAPTALGTLGEVLPTTGWEPPPNNIKGLVQFQNGVIAGFYGNQVYMSSPDAYYAFPVDHHRYTVGPVIRAMGVFNEDLIIATARHPYILTGTDPASMTKTKFDINQPCLSKRAFKVTHFGAIWPGPDGMFLFDGNPPGKVVTAGIWTRKQWLALSPDQLIGAYYNLQYFGFWYGTTNGFVLNFIDDEPYVIDIELANEVYGTYVDPEDDELYLLTFDDANYLIEKWEGALTRMSCIHRSGMLQTIPTNLPWAQVIGDFSAGNATFKLYADGALKHTQTVSSAAPFRLPDDFDARTWEVQIETVNAMIDTYALGKGIHDLGYEI